MNESACKLADRWFADHQQQFKSLTINILIKFNLNNAIIWANTQLKTK
jgi:hypothetical protein